LCLFNENNFRFKESKGKDLKKNAIVLGADFLFKFQKALCYKNVIYFTAKYKKGILT